MSTTKRTRTVHITYISCGTCPLEPSLKNWRGFSQLPLRPPLYTLLKIWRHNVRQNWMPIVFFFIFGFLFFLPASFHGDGLRDVVLVDDGQHFVLIILGRFRELEFRLPSHRPHKSNYFQIRIMWFIPTLSSYITIDSQRCWTFPDSNGLVLVLMACAVTAGAPPGLRWANTMDSSDSLADGNGCCHITPRQREKEMIIIASWKCQHSKSVGQMLATHSSVVGEKIFQHASVFGHENLADGFPIVVRWSVAAEKKKRKLVWAFLLSIFSTQMAAVVKKIRNKNNKNKIKKEIKGKKRIETGNGLNDWTCLKTHAG